MARFSSRPPRVPMHKADATLDQANPVSGTKYEVLAETKNCRLMSVSVKVTWTVQPTPLQVWLTIDGVTIQADFVNPVSATNYYFMPSYPDTATWVLSTSPMLKNKPFLIEGRSIKVEVETTGGTVSNITSRVKYQKW